jgi:poly(3-hydroxybutyrate) depolymerase
MEPEELLKLDEYNYLINHILVAPEGYDQGWNIAKEDTKAPDLDFIKKIIIHLKTFEKIDADQISIIGHSNGAALVNQLLIELESESFKKAVFTFCQLNAFQYREGSFWARSNIDSEVHDLEVLPATNNRKILSFAGTEDTACIYYGGEGIHKYNFVNAELAAFVWAKAFGYEGVQIENPIEEAAPLENFYRFSYLDGKVIHYKLQGAGHGWEQDNKWNDDGKRLGETIIKNFIEN